MHPLLGVVLVACGPVSGDSDDTDGQSVGIEELDPDDLPVGDDPCHEAMLVEVVEITDGDTVHVASDGTELIVRMIGLDTPEVSHGSDPSECWGEEAAAYTTERLLGEQAWLTFDEECTDAYGRTLAYIHLGTESDDFYNVQLVRDGQAEVLTIEPNDTFSELFLEAEGEARLDDAGLWGQCI